MKLVTAATHFLNNTEKLLKYAKLLQEPGLRKLLNFNSQPDNSRISCSKLVLRKPLS